MNIPEPKFSYPFLSFFNGCGCCEKSKEKKDCYFYEEVQDMGAHIPTCNYYAKLGYCPCENCNKYIKSSDVFKKVKEYVDKIDN